jgi:hypothetical protein
MPGRIIGQGETSQPLCNAASKPRRMRFASAGSFISMAAIARKTVARTAPNLCMALAASWRSCFISSSVTVADLSSPQQLPRHQILHRLHSAYYTSTIAALNQARVIRRPVQIEGIASAFPAAQLDLHTAILAVSRLICKASAKQLRPDEELHRRGAVLGTAMGSLAAGRLLAIHWSDKRRRAQHASEICQGLTPSEQPCGRRQFQNIRLGRVPAIAAYAQPQAVAQQA